MKTTIDIPDDELRDAVRFTKAKTKREAVVTILEAFNRRHRMAELVIFACAKTHGLEIAHDGVHFDELAKLDTA